VELWIFDIEIRPLDLSSSRAQMGALGHTLTPFCSVCRQFFGFITGDVHVLQISSDDVHPIFPWASLLLDLEMVGLPVYFNGKKWPSIMGTGT